MVIMIINTDLHVHSMYSMATSKNMNPENMAVESSKKGLNLIATGDAFHFKWLKQLESSLTEIYDGIYKTNDTIKQNNTHFITTCEVEDNQRIHHLIIIPSIETAWQIRDELKAKNIDADGRPKLRMNAKEIMDTVKEYGCLIGPAHVFTPWTGIYKEYDSVYDCYERKADFIELGLSSDSMLADSIGELRDYTFLSNSDSHSPWPHRIGREFNKMQIRHLSFKGICDSIKHNNVLENYGFDPRMGKYHQTGCIKCFKAYDIHEAVKKDMKCDCGGRIKKGVKSRIEELSTTKEKNRKRPHYQYILPLAELLSTVHNKGITTKYVQSRYDNLIKEFDNEINVLINVDIKKIEKTDENLAKIINSYRKNTLKVISGRAGQYGKIIYEE